MYVLDTLVSTTYTLLQCTAYVLQLFLQLEVPSTFKQTVSKIWQEEGVRSLVKGLSARLMYSCPTSAILVSSYELMKRLCVKKDVHISLQ